MSEKYPEYFGVESRITRYLIAGSLIAITAISAVAAISVALLNSRKEFFLEVPGVFVVKINDGLKVEKIHDKTKAEQFRIEVGDIINRVCGYDAISREGINILKKPKQYPPRMIISKNIKQKIF